MKLLTFYFSGTGNTWWVTKRFSEIAIEQGHSAEYFSIEDKKLNDPDFLINKINNTEGLGIAYPIYGSTTPYIIRDFMERLTSIIKNHLDANNERKREINNESKNHKFGYVLTTMAMFSGDGALVLKKDLANLGFNLQGAINLRLASNISVPGFHFDPVNQEKLDKRKVKAEQKISDFIEILSNEKKKLEGRWNIFGKIGGGLQRVFLDGTMKKILKFNINTKACTKCMLCVNNCPTQNIAFKDDDFLFSESCTYCMRCYNYCPTYAINIKDKDCDPDKYLRFRGPIEGLKIKEFKR